MTSYDLEHIIGAALICLGLAAILCIALAALIDAANTRINNAVNEALGPEQEDQP